MQLAKLIAAVLLSVCLLGSSCQPDVAALLPEGERPSPGETGATLIARFVHVTDTHAVDTESPGRFTGAHDLVPAAWRPWEAYSTQILDGIIRTANGMHASGRQINFLLHTGDACDNSQTNELSWFITIMDGGVINPLSGPDDRPVEARPDPLSDPYATFQTQGLYQHGVHGDFPSIPWYGTMGNHDTFAIGVFPIESSWWGARIAPLPLSLRPGLFLPRYLDPLGEIAYGPVSPANPGPPCLFEIPVFVQPNSERAYLEPGDFVRAMLASPTEPPGHGFAGVDVPYYSVSPVVGLRLIGLYTDDVISPVSGLPYHQGCISADQLAWFRSQLDAAAARGELVIVASHHPSNRLETLYGSAVGPDEFRALLNQYPCVVLHLVGHDHANRVSVRGNYIEIETCSTIDWPQEARVVELWRDDSDGSIGISYSMFSHVDDRWPPVGSDPLRPLREHALALAGGTPLPTQRAITSPGDQSEQEDLGDPAGTPHDRADVIRIRPGH